VYKDNQPPTHSFGTKAAQLSIEKEENFNFVAALFGGYEMGKCKSVGGGMGGPCSRATHTDTHTQRDKNAVIVTFINRMGMRGILTALPTAKLTSKKKGERKGRGGGSKKKQQEGFAIFSAMLHI